MWTYGNANFYIIKSIKRVSAPSEKSQIMAFIEKIENKIFYYISIPKKDFVPNDFTEKIILKSKYLRVEHIGNMNKLKDTINYVYKEIIPKNNILVENRQFVYFEKYDYKFHWNREDSVIEIYIPIK